MKYKFFIVAGLVVVAVISFLAHKKTKGSNVQSGLLSEAQNKIEQQQAQIDDLVKFKDDQQRINKEKTEENKEKETKESNSTETADNQPVIRNKTISASTSDTEQLKKQQECQKKINEYNECVNGNSTRMAEYSACLAKHTDSTLPPPCFKIQESCHKPDCAK